MIFIFQFQLFHVIASWCILCMLCMLLMLEMLEFSMVKHSCLSHHFLSLDRYPVDCLCIPGGCCQGIKVQHSGAPRAQGPDRSWWVWVELPEIWSGTLTEAEPPVALWAVSLAKVVLWQKKSKRWVGGWLHHEGQTPHGFTLDRTTMNNQSMLDIEEVSRSVSYQTGFAESCQLARTRRAYFAQQPQRGQLLCSSHWFQSISHSFQK